MNKSIWKIEIHFHDKHHNLISSIILPDTEYIGNETIEEIVYPKMLEKIRELNWEGFGLWAQHEAIYKQTILDEINYQRRSDGNIILDCEDHACNYRAITTPLVKENECTICMTELNNNNRVIPMCFHSMVCNDCNKTLDKCPMCRKPFKTNNNKTLI